MVFCIDAVPMMMVMDYYYLHYCPVLIEPAALLLRPDHEHLSCIPLTWLPDRSIDLGNNWLYDVSVPSDYIFLTYYERCRRLIFCLSPRLVGIAGRPACMSVWVRDFGQ